MAPAPAIEPLLAPVAAPPHEAAAIEHDALAAEEPPPPQAALQETAKPSPEPQPAQQPAPPPAWLSARTAPKAPAVIPLVHAPDDPGPEASDDAEQAAEPQSSGWRKIFE